jgi:hypothetical protein
VRDEDIAERAIEDNLNIPLNANLFPPNLLGTRTAAETVRHP